MSLENVFLTRIVRVSTVMWQPEFFVERQADASPGGSSSPPS